MGVVVAAAALERCRGQQVAERSERWQTEPTGQASAGQLYSRPVAALSTGRRPSHTFAGSTGASAQCKLRNYEYDSFCTTHVLYDAMSGLCCALTSPLAFSNYCAAREEAGGRLGDRRAAGVNTASAPLQADAGRTSRRVCCAHIAARSSQRLRYSTPSLAHVGLLHVGAHSASWRHCWTRPERNGTSGTHSNTVLREYAHATLS